MLLTLMSLVLVVVGIFGTIFALMSNELNQNNKLRYGIVIALIFFTLYAAGGSWYAISNQSSNQPSTPQPTLPASTIPILYEETIYIDTIPFHAFAYGGEYEPGLKGRGNLSIERTQGDNTNYRLEYFLPEEDIGYAGLAFRFSKPQDLTGYNYIEITITFGYKNAGCDLIFRDIDNKTENIRLGENFPSSDDAIVTIAGLQYTIKIPLRSTLKELNQELIKEITFNVDTGFIRGNSGFTINTIKFSKS